MHHSLNVLLHYLVKCCMVFDCWPMTRVLFYELGVIASMFGTFYLLRADN